MLLLLPYIAVYVRKKLELSDFYGNNKFAQYTYCNMRMRAVVNGFKYRSARSPDTRDDSEVIKVSQNKHEDENIKYVKSCEVHIKAKVLQCC